MKPHKFFPFSAANWGVRTEAGAWMGSKSVRRAGVFTGLRRVSFNRRHDACRWIDRHQERLRQQAIDTLKEWTP